jgi:hypothetical protein
MLIDKVLLDDSYWAQNGRGVYSIAVLTRGKPHLA